MAVYTHIDDQALAGFLAGYDLGTLQSFKGIAKGVSNTNYFVQTDKNKYILTIFEEHRTKREDLPFYFGFSNHLAGKGIACPQALPDRHGNVIGTLNGKPAVFVNFLEGADIERGRTTPAHCGEMGGFAAKLHVAGSDFKQSRENTWAMKNWRKLADGIRSKMDSYSPGLEKLVYNELDFIEANWPKDLPRAVIHGDLFPDNIFFQGDEISAAIDFYFSCTEFVVFDLAIVINAWCFDMENKFQRERYDHLMNEYQAVRPLSHEEAEALPIMLRGTALRYLLSRLQELFAHTADTMMIPHNPQEYIDKLRFHQKTDVTA